MNNAISFDDILKEMQRSDNKEQIEYYCRAFCQQVDFKHYLLFGSIFTSLLSPPGYAIGSPDKTIKDKKQQLETIALACMHSFTPIITGNIDKHSILNNSLFKTCLVPSAKQISISFPVHFPVGKLAFLHISTPIKKQDVEAKVLSSLASGNLFAKTASTSLLHLLECELETKPPYLSPREKECLLLASDGTAPQQIADQIGLSPHTVTFHLKKAREKLKSKNIQGAISKAMLRGDISAQTGSGKG